MKKGSKIKYGNGIYYVESVNGNNVKAYAQGTSSIVELRLNDCEVLKENSFEINGHKLNGALEIKGNKITENGNSNTPHKRLNG